VERKAFTLAIENALGDYSGYVLVLDKAYKPIAAISSDGDLEIPGSLLSRLDMKKWSLDPASVYTVSVDKEEFSIVTKISSYNGLSYVLAMPTKQFFSKVHASRNLLALAALGVILLGALLGLLFSNRNYLPLRKLAEELRGTDRDKIPQGNQDEMVYLQSTVQQIIKDNQDLATQLKSRAGMIRDQLLSDIIMGKAMDWKARKEMLAASDIFLEGLDYSVFLISIDDYPEFQRTHPSAEVELYRFSMANLAENCSQEYGNGYAVDLGEDRGIVLILGLERGGDSREAKEKLARGIQEVFKRYFEFACTIGVGGSYDDPLGIHTSYTEATRAVFHRVLKGKGEIIFYPDIAHEQERVYVYPAELEQQLFRCIREGNTEDIQRVAHEIVNDIRSQHLVPEAVQCICFGVLNSILRALNELEIETDSAFQTDFEYILLQRYDSLGVLETRMASLGRNASDLVQRLREHKKSDRMDRITEYVLENYTRYSLTLDEIADRFNLSPSYITTFFKEQMGTTLMSYIDKLRMQDVKELLKSTALTQKEIMQKVGYFDQTNFIRKFRSAEGVTPAVYRTMVQDDIAEGNTLRNPAPDPDKNR
jgi:AraC-like DNA-binding protein